MRAQQFLPSIHPVQLQLNSGRERIDAAPFGHLQLLPLLLLLLLLLSLIFPRAIRWPFKSTNRAEIRVVVTAAARARVAKAASGQKLHATTVTHRLLCL